MKFDKSEADFGEKNIEMKLHEIPFKCCKNKYLQWFQCRLNYRKLGTNNLLHKMKIKQSNLCCYCKEKPETVFHLFCECEKVKSFWIDFIKYLQDGDLKIEVLSNVEKIFGNKLFDDTLNTILILARNFIFKHRISEKIPTIQRFIVKLKDHYETEHAIARKDCILEEFNKRWAPYSKMV